MMRIKFIGASHGVPEPNRKCSCTMIEIQGRYYFIDMGTPIIDHLVTAGIPIEAVKGIFITHMHGDHTNGLIHLVDLLSWYYKTSDPVIFLPKTDCVTIMKIGLRQIILRLVNYAMKRSAGVIYNDGFLKVTAVQTLHSDCSYAFFLEAEGNPFFYRRFKTSRRDFPAIAKNMKRI